MKESDVFRYIALLISMRILIVLPLFVIFSFGCSPFTSNSYYFPRPEQVLDTSNTSEINSGSVSGSTIPQSGLSADVHVVSLSLRHAIQPISSKTVGGYEVLINLSEVE